MTASLEEYLKTIYILIKTRDKARVTDIANYLGCAKASVNRALGNLKKNGYLAYEAYGEIELTQEGKKEAENIVKRHNILKAFLVNVLDVEPEVAEQEAKTMKHAISEDTIQKFSKYITSIIDVNELDCAYNPSSEKCIECVRRKTKKQFDKVNK